MVFRSPSPFQTQVGPQTTVPMGLPRFQFSSFSARSRSLRSQAAFSFISRMSMSGLLFSVRVVDLNGRQTELALRRLNDDRRPPVATPVDVAGREDKEVREVKNLDRPEVLVHVRVADAGVVRRLVAER